MTAAIDKLLQKHKVLFKDELGTMKIYRYACVLNLMHPSSSIGKDLLLMPYDLLSNKSWNA